MHRRKLMIVAVLFAASSILASCATRSPDPPPVEQPKAQAPDPKVCSDLKGEPAVEGTIVAPASIEERLATSLHLRSDQAARDWGREGWGRAKLARDLLCPG